jgi:hypothetical protein
VKGAKGNNPTSFDDGKEVSIGMLRCISVLLVSVLLMVALAANVALAAPPTGKGQPGVAEPKVTGSPNDPNAWGSVASQLGSEGIMGEHSSDPVPRVPGHETPRDGLGNVARNDATDHNTPACPAEGCDTGDHMADHACIAAAAPVPGTTFEPDCTAEPGRSA